MLEEIKEHARNLVEAINKALAVETPTIEISTQDYTYLEELKKSLDAHKNELTARVDKLNEQCLIVEEQRDNAEELLGQIEDLELELEDLLE